MISQGHDAPSRRGWERCGPKLPADTREEDVVSVAFLDDDGQLREPGGLLERVRVRPGIEDGGWGGGCAAGRGGNGGQGDDKLNSASQFVHGSIFNLAQLRLDVSSRILPEQEGGWIRGFWQSPG